MSSWKGENGFSSGETEFCEVSVKLARKQDEWIGFVIEEFSSLSFGVSEAIQVFTVSTDNCEMSVNGDSFEKRIGTGVSEFPKCEVTVFE